MLSAAHFFEKLAEYAPRYIWSDKDHVIIGVARDRSLPGTYTPVDVVLRHLPVGEGAWSTKVLRELRKAENNEHGAHKEVRAAILQVIRSADIPY